VSLVSKHRQEGREAGGRKGGRKKGGRSGVGRGEEGKHLTFLNFSFVHCKMGQQ
jgi:hypothetical protein